MSPDQPAVTDQPLKPTVKPPRKRRLWPIVVGALVAAVLLFIGIPRVIRALNTISTDARQSVMAIRSLRDIWIDANFKETQIRDLRIGQHVDLELDTYGGKHLFEGRISGFTFGTGSTLALLPAQNATGNFVKVVQRLPVRIDVINYDPDKLPLFVGLSVTPTVDLRSAPTGPNAGKFLQAPEPAAGPVSPTP
jgi:multidrug resistance efflux pump